MVRAAARTLCPYCIVVHLLLATLYRRLATVTVERQLILWAERRRCMCAMQILQHTHTSDSRNHNMNTTQQQP